MSGPRGVDSNIVAAEGSDNWSTPFSLGARLDHEFDLQPWDPCPINPEGIRCYDGKIGSPESITRYRMNPPYSKVAPWLQLARTDQLKGKLVCVIIKGDTSTNWFYELVRPYAELRLVHGRVRFGDKGLAPFNTIVAIYRPNCERAGQVSWMEAQVVEGKDSRV